MGVRVAQRSDLPRLDEIEREAFGAQAAGAMADELARSWAQVSVAVHPTDEVVGYLIAWRIVDELEVIQVATHPDARRQGYARALLEALIDRARADLVVRVLLEVRPSNVGAVTLYRALGFAELSRRERYYNDGEDALVMELKLG